MALLPKVGALIAIVPPFVLGRNVDLYVRHDWRRRGGILADSLRSQRDLLLFAASVGLATAVNFAPPALFQSVPESLGFLPPMAS